MRYHAARVKYLERKLIHHSETHPFTPIARDFELEIDSPDIEKIRSHSKLLENRVAYLEDLLTKQFEFFQKNYKEPSIQILNCKKVFTKICTELPETQLYKFVVPPHSKYQHNAWHFDESIFACYCHHYPGIAVKVFSDELPKFEARFGVVGNKIWNYVPWDSIEMIPEWIVKSYHMSKRSKKNQLGENDLLLPGSDIPKWEPISIKYSY